MSRMRHLATGAALGALLALAAAALLAPAGRSAGATSGAVAVGTGSPAAGKALFSSLGCGGCHSLDDAASTPSAGPVLSRPRLAERAVAARKALGPFVAESIVSPPADASPGWVSAVMRSYAELRPTQLDDLVAFLVDAPYRGSGPAGLPLPADPLKACDGRRSCRATVARWTASLRLPRGVVPGAKVLATVGCLSCHSFGGAGTVGAAPDLTRGTTKGASVPVLARWIRCARCVDSGVAMPTFGALSQVNVRRIAELLAARRGGGR